jgi:hypothetical protein
MLLASSLAGCVRLNDPKIPRMIKLKSFRTATQTDSVRQIIRSQRHAPVALQLFCESGRLPARCAAVVELFHARDPQSAAVKPPCELNGGSAVSVPLSSSGTAGWRTSYHQDNRRNAIRCGRMRTPTLQELPQGEIQFLQAWFQPDL